MHTSIAIRLLACGAVAPLLAAGPSAGSRIHFSTCTLPGVEHGCIVAVSAGKTYDVTGARPGLAAHQWFQGTATVSGNASTCMQGPVVTDFRPDPQQAMVACVTMNARPRRR